MRSKTFFCLLFLGFFVTSVTAYDSVPVAISPGSEEGAAAVAKICPTFSWTAVDWAETYKVEVFEVVGTEVLSHEKIQALSFPVISKEIRGRALSWTPASDERLMVGGEYVWYVQAADTYSQRIWSEGRLFKVDVGLRFDGVEENVRERLWNQGVSEEVIGQVLEDMVSGVKDMIVYGVDTKGSSSSTQDKVQIQDLEGEGTSNTGYGLGAGVNFAAGAIYNSLFGVDAGYRTDWGDKNTFIGYKAGYDEIGTPSANNTYIGYQAGYGGSQGARLQNTFVGAEAGYGVQGGVYNTFMGHNAGRSIVNGNNNTFIGYQAGYSMGSAHGSVFLGYQAGYSEVGGNKLYIDNSSTLIPLI